MTSQNTNSPSVINNISFSTIMQKNAFIGKLIAKTIGKGVSSIAKGLVGTSKLIDKGVMKVTPKAIQPGVQTLLEQKLPLGMLAVSGGPKGMIIDPLMEAGADAKHSYESLRAGDYSTAGGYALSGLGNAIWGLGGASMALPAVGALTGMGIKGVGSVTNTLLKTKTLKKFIKKHPTLLGKGKWTSAPGRLANRAGDYVMDSGTKLQNALSNTPGSKWTGLNLGSKMKNRGMGKSMGGRGRNKDTMFKSIARPVGLSLGLSTAGGIGKYFGTEAYFDDLSQDGNFRDWMGPRGHDNWINNGSSVKNRVDQVNALDNAGLYKSYKKNLKLKEKQYIKDQEEADRVNSYGWPTKYTRPTSTVDSLF